MLRLYLQHRNYLITCRRQNSLLFLRKEIISCFVITIGRKPLIIYWFFERSRGKLVPIYVYPVYLFVTFIYSVNILFGSSRGGYHDRQKSICPASCVPYC